MSQIWKFSRLGGISTMDKLDYDIDKIMDAIPWIGGIIREDIVDNDPEY